MCGWGGEVAMEKFLWDSCDFSIVVPYKSNNHASFFVILSKQVIPRKNIASQMS